MPSMGMDKSGDQAITSNVWTKLTDFVVRSGYPDTVLSSSALVLPAATGDITFRGSFTSAGNTQQFRVVKNGSTPLGSVGNNGATVTVSGQTMVAGDTLELQAFTDTAFTQRRNVSGGSGTYVGWNQTSANLPIEGSTVTTWQGTAEITKASTYDIAGSHSTAWQGAAGVGIERTVQGSRPTTWGRSGSLYLGQRYDIEGERVTTWSGSAELSNIRPAESLLPDFATIAVSIHTVDGRGVGNFLCDDIAEVTWGREGSEVSTCALTVFTEGSPDLVEDLRPWLHWVTVWHSSRPMWVGVIQSVKIASNLTVINVRDTSTLMWRTRVPISKTWVDTDPTGVADEILSSMLDLHRVQNVPIVLPGVTESFTYRAESDTRMVHQTMDDLLKLGLEWTVVAGVFILGKFDETPFTELYECDFLVEIERLRDGVGTFNDIRVQGMNFAQTAVAPLGELRLQTLVALDDVFGVSNIQRAAQLYVNETGTIRDVLQIPGGAALHPDAPVELHDLIPGRVLRVTAGAVSSLMRIDQVQFSATPDTQSVQVTLVAVQENTEIGELVPGGSRS